MEGLRNFGGGGLNNPLGTPLHEVACFCPNCCSSITSWFGQSHCRTAYTYISTSFWLHRSPSSAYFGPTDSSLDIYNPHACKFLVDICLHCVPSAEVFFFFQINGLNCDKLYTANVFEKSRTPRRFFLLIIVMFLRCI